jgi:hypothetical protein
MVSKDEATKEEFDRQLLSAVTESVAYTSSNTGTA